MAIYHLEAKIITRGEGRSAVAAAAYIGCDRIYNDYDGIQHDYTKKQGLVWEQVFLPDNAPREWADRSALWNAVEESEKSKDSRLAREFVVALPVELKKDEWISLLSDFIKDNFVSDGMCADVAIHDTDGHNPHAHIMLTVRPLNEKGEWQNKTEKEYLCIRNGEEKGFTAAEFKTAQKEGWEKQYQYKAGKKKAYLPPSEADMQGYERVSKNPKSTRYGRQNPITERWNSDEQLVKWREAWASISNKYLERAGREEKIDHRSFKERGIDEQPTIHEGVTARALESKGIVSERCELNRQIRRDNSILRDLKEKYNRLLEIFKKTLPYAAKAMELVRSKLIFYSYQLRSARMGKKQRADYISSMKSFIKQYDDLTEKIKTASDEYKSLVSEKENTSVINIPRRRKLTARIDELTEQIVRLKNEKIALLKNLDCKEGDIPQVRKDTVDTEAELKNMIRLEKTYSDFTDEVLKGYAEVKEQAKDFDPVELYEARQEIRPEMEQEAENQLRRIYGDKFRANEIPVCKNEASRLMNEEAEKRSVRETIRQRQREIEMRKREQANEQQQTNVQHQKRKNRGAKR